MSDPTFSFRKACQGMVGLGLYSIFWACLVLTPIALLIVPFVLPVEREDKSFDVLTFVIIVVGGVIWYGVVVLLALLARWMARGILHGAKGRIVFSAILAALVGTGYLFISGEVPQGQTITFIGFGLMFLFVAAALLSTLLPSAWTE